MAEVSMNRAIHGAFRRDLARFDKAFATFADSDTRRAVELGKAWDNFEDQLNRHHEGEHEIAWPALMTMGVPAELLAQLDAEHDRIITALAAASKAVGAFRTTSGGPDAVAARAAIANLGTVATEHLDHEEAELEQLYLDKQDTPEMKAMGRKFGKVSPPVAGTFFAWVMDGADPDEQQAIKGNVPGPVLAILGGIFGRSYRKNIAPTWR